MGRCNPAPAVSMPIAPAERTSGHAKGSAVRRRERRGRACKLGLQGIVSKCKRLTLDQGGDLTGSEDLVDQAYFPFIRPLGNLVVLCAQAEAALLAFVAELMRRDEPAAQAVFHRRHGSFCPHIDPR